MQGRGRIMRVWRTGRNSFIAWQRSASDSGVAAGGRFTASLAGARILGLVGVRVSVRVRRIVNVRQG